MTKKQYSKCEEYSKSLKDIPEDDTLVKASQLLSDGGYWGPEAEGTILPEDINIDALKIQMQLFLKRFGNGTEESSEDFQELVNKVIQSKERNGVSSDATEEIVHYHCLFLTICEYSNLNVLQEMLIVFLNSRGIFLTFCEPFIISLSWVFVISLRLTRLLVLFCSL